MPKLELMATTRLRAHVRRALLASLALLCTLLASSRAQSLLVFMQWLNWPPFKWSAPDAPSPLWVRILGALLHRFNWSANAFPGLPGTKPFSAKGALGTIRGWRIPRQGPGQCTVLYLHGNAGNIAVYHRVQLYKLLSAAPFFFDVVAIDYGGFGHSDGFWPDEASAVTDALAALDGMPDDRRNVIVWGHSLGTGVAVAALAALSNGKSPTRHSEERLPLGLVLEAPLLSVPAVAASCLPCRATAQRMLGRFLQAHYFPSEERVEGLARALGGKLIVLHGRHDRVVPYYHGLKLAEKAQQFPPHSFERGHDDIVKDPRLVGVLQSSFDAWRRFSG